MDTMIQLARAAKSNRMIVAGPNSSEVFLELHHRGYLRVTTAKLCGVPCGQFDVALVAWRERSINAIETTLNGLVQFLSTTGPLESLIDSFVEQLSQVFMLRVFHVGTIC
jgi:hypothetical protein